VNVRICTDYQSEKPKRYAFVRFTEDSDARDAIEEYNGTVLHGKTMRLRPAVPKKGLGAAAPGSFGASAEGGGGAAAAPASALSPSAGAGGRFARATPNAILTGYNPYTQPTAATAAAAASPSASAYGYVRLLSLSLSVAASHWFV
jgi:RNA recognition motif-containing protein